MAIPKVFISSTCYDLKYVREDLKFFVKTVGYEPILSDDGDVYYNPETHTHDSCISEISTCQIFVLIIGGRFGGKYKETDKSITNMEYEKAKSLGIPIFTLVEQSVYSDHHVYSENLKENKDIDAKKIKYPSIDNPKIFDFIDEVRKAISNNAIFAFNNFSDIQNYLKKQWAGMMYHYITSEAESKRVTELFEKIQEATNKIEFFTRQTASSVGSNVTKLTIMLYDMMFHSEVVRHLSLIWDITLSPQLIIQKETIDDLCDRKIKLDDNDDSTDYDHVISIKAGGPPYICSYYCYIGMADNYIKLRTKLIREIQSSGIALDEFINS